MATKTTKKEKPKHLGRGLESLMGPIKYASTDTQTPIPIVSVATMSLSGKDLKEGLQYLSLNQIRPNPYQPRTVWNQQELNDLAESIKANGVIQPIVVREAEDGFEMIAGERRLRAAQLAELEVIPALIRNATQEQMLELALVENIHRTNLNSIERAKAYQNYIRTFSLTQGQAAERLGEDRSVIANYIRLLDLPQDIQKMLIDGTLSMGHARAILGLPTNDLRNKLANRALAGRLSVREVERLVRKHLSTDGQEKTSIQTKKPHIIDLENKLTHLLGTRVNIDTRKNGQRGKIVIEFYSLDEFDRITEHIGAVQLDEV
ncbi:MAG: ParB/RepB/Spo0J family partition protein [Planctomycetota bacterium]|jgi:ParB family chromosome partitioning protein